MSKNPSARLTWIPGARKAPPTGPRYVTVARFEGQGDAWLKDAWSLVIEFDAPPDAQHSHQVYISFLADGPQRFLESGKSFEMMEGAVPVARGRIL